MRTAALAVGLLAVSLQVAAAQKRPPEPLAFVCKFTWALTLEHKEHWSEEAKDQVFEFTLAGLDPQRGEAQMIGNAGAAKVHYSSGTYTWNFVEVTGAGNVMLTTVFKKGPGQSYPAVHTRHTALGSEPLPSLNSGTCLLRD